MANLLIHNTVEDFATWKPVFDKYADMRRAAGAKGGRLFHTADNPNDVLILFEWDDLKNAREFAASDGLREAMQEAGVLGRPEVFFLEDGEDLAE